MANKKLMGNKKVINAANKVMDNFVHGKGLQKIKTGGAIAGFLAVVPSVLLIVTNLGSLLGNTLIDAPMNQELRDQADGVAVLQKEMEEFTK